MSTPMKNLAAFTEAHPSYPAYISANEWEGAKVVVTVRSRGNFGAETASIEISKADLLDFAEKIVEKLKKSRTEA